MADARAFVPPEPPHTASYSWIGSQGAHRIGNVTVEDANEAVILTASAQAHRECERFELVELGAAVVADLLDAREDDDSERVGEIVDKATGESGDESESEPDADADADRPPIPEDLGDLDYRGDENADATDSLQDLAQAYGIAATQSAGNLQDALAAKRDAGGEEGDG